MKAKVWVLGDAVVDLLPESEGRLLQCPGGAPANVAVGVARLGGNSGFIGRVGGDPFGRYMRHTLQQEQVDVSHMYLDDHHRTSTVVVDLDDQGERTLPLWYAPALTCSWLKKTCHSLPPDSGCTSAPSRSAPSPAAVLPSRLWRTSNVPVAG